MKTKIRLVAYKKRKYVDSITTSDAQTIADFYQDFHDCEISQFYAPRKEVQ